MDLSFSQPDDPERERSKWPPSDKKGCRTRVTIDLGRFEENVRRTLSLLPMGVKLLPVIKANAYGHGLLPIVSSLQRIGIVQVAVMGFDEACQIRQGGYDETIVLLGGFDELELAYCLKYNFTPVLHHPDQIACLESLSSDGVLNVHIKIDSGMGRLGFLPDELPGILDRIAVLNHVQIRGGMTHFPLSENRKDTEGCVRLFQEALSSVSGHPALKHLEVIHMANSAAVLNGFSEWPESVRVGGNAVRPSFWARPGLLLYGYFPIEGVREEWTKIRPIMKVDARLVSVRSLPKGSTISYGRTVTLSRNSRIGIIGMGYADGLPRGVSGQGWATISGVKAPFLGRVCMDMVAVDLTDVPEGLSSGDWVSIIDPDSPESMSVDLLAGWLDTIAYEILCLIGHRSERKYIAGAIPTYQGNL
ncbi:MAG: alanine racemase [Nitrospirota bacterium]|nr:alanine racemase [Nitrospirota bacterium]